MSRWGVVVASLVAVGFLSLPLLFVQANRSGRMAGWDARVSRWRPAEDQRPPPAWYVPAVAGGLLVGGLVVWLLTHDWVRALSIPLPGVPPTVYGLWARHQARTGTLRDPGR